MTDVIDLSLSEIDALSRKACVGLGYSWGLAEDAGQAIKWLSAAGLPAADALAQHLTQLDEGIAANGLCPIKLGTQFCDGLYLVANEDVDLGRVAAPIILLPFVSWRAATLKTSLSVEVNGAQWTVLSDGQLVAPTQTTFPDAAQVLIKKCEFSSAKGQPLNNRALVGKATYACLDHFAQRTYAPATEASRIAGAGAGVTDND